MRYIRFFTAATGSALLLVSGVAWAAPDLTWHGPAAGAAAVQREQVGFQALMPSLRCGAAGEPANSCRLSGTLQVRGPEDLNGLQGYLCVVRYSYTAGDRAGFKVSFQREEPLVHTGQPVQPGVAATQEKTRQTKSDLPFGKPVPQEETVRLRGTTHLRGTVMLHNGRAVVQLHEGAPIMLPEQVRQVELDDLACSAE